MNKFIIPIFLILIACADNTPTIKPFINLSEFPGFSIIDNTKIENVKLDGYEYKSADGGLISFDSCIKAVQSGETQVAGYELFRFRLLLASCFALEKYLSSKPANKIYLPCNLENKYISS